MSVTFIHNNGRKQVMQERYAKVLTILKRGTYQTRDMVAASPIEPVEVSAPQTFKPEPQPQEEDSEATISSAAEKLAIEHEIDIASVTGTGRNGRINLRDIEAVLAGRKS